MRQGAAPVRGSIRENAVSLGLGFAADDFGYLVDPGLPAPRSTAFENDPEIKGEFVWAGPLARPAALLVERRNAVVRARIDRDRQSIAQHIHPVDSVLAEMPGTERAPELMRLRSEIRGWRFYDQFRSDSGAPARRPQIGTCMPVLDHEVAQLAAALQTIRESGNAAALDAAVDDVRAVAPRSRRRAASRWRCVNTACCAPCAAPSSPAARCATCSGSPRCSRRVPPRCWC